MPGIMTLARETKKCDVNLLKRRWIPSVSPPRRAALEPSLQPRDVIIWLFKDCRCGGGGAFSDGNRSVNRSENKRKMEK